MIKPLYRMQIISAGGVLACPVSSLGIWSSKSPRMLMRVHSDNSIRGCQHINPALKCSLVLHIGAHDPCHVEVMLPRLRSRAPYALTFRQCSFMTASNQTASSPPGSSYSSWLLSYSFCKHYPSSV